MTIVAGHDLSITVPFAAEPQPKAHWSINGYEVTSDTRITIDLSQHEARFYNKKAKRSDTGTYNIQLTNSEATWSMDMPWPDSVARKRRLQPWDDGPLPVRCVGSPLHPPSPSPGPGDCLSIKSKTKCEADSSNCKWCQYNGFGICGVKSLPCP